MNENIITVTGNLCTPPEFRQTRSGSPMLTFRVASTHRYFNNRTTQWEEGVANFYDVVAYRQLAVNAHKSLSKGDAIILQGQFKTRRYERQDGTFGIGMEIEARLLGPDLAYGVATFLRAPRPQVRPADTRSHGQAQQSGQTDPWVNQRTGEVAPWGGPGGGRPVEAGPIDPESVGFDVVKDDEAPRSFTGRWAEPAGSDQAAQDIAGLGDEDTNREDSDHIDHDHEDPTHEPDHEDEHENEHEEQLVGAAD